MKLVLFFVFLLSVVLSCLQVSQAEESVQVTIQNGPIVGKKIPGPWGGQSVNQFLGIPFARPPLGKLRFRRPVPADRWSEPIQALEWPNNCHHLSELVKVDIPFMNGNFSEDCLYLNVWSPDVTVDDDKLRPVVVFIHGGALILGGSSFDLYNGNILSMMGNVVVVTINYRLSTFGFLYSDSVDDIKGNQGLWDQALALEWVNENIRYFGGDPKSITISGNSAGSWSVSSHILSPVSRNLFQNAIMFSGAALPKAIRDAKTMTESFLYGIRKVGCATEQDTSITQSVIDCLDSLDVNTIAMVPFFSEKLYDWPDMLTIDGEFFPAHPAEMLASGNHKVNFNLIASTVEDEGSFIMDLHKQEPRFRRFNPEPITLDEAKNYLTELMTSKILNEPVDNETITRFYFAGLNADFDHPNLFRKQVGIAYGDYVLACPTIEFAKRVFKSSPESVNVYQLHYAAKFGQEKFLCSEWMGSCHCNELYPVFGMPFRYPDQYHYREHEISYQMITLISSFARSGNPGETHPQWDKYFVANNGKDVVAPYYEISNEVTSHKSYKFNLKQFECENIWSRYLFDTGSKE